MQNSTALLGKLCTTLYSKLFQALFGIKTLLWLVQTPLIYIVLSALTVDSLFYVLTPFFNLFVLIFFLVL